MEIPYDYQYSMYNGSVSGKALDAVWNADGSLAKVVFSATGKPAAGESVFFGVMASWEEMEDVLVMDGKGLPLTGCIAQMQFADSSWSVYLGADGRATALGTEDENTLVQLGKTWYVVDGAVIQTQPTVTALPIDRVLNPSAADRKTLDCYREIADALSKSLWVFVNPDGSVCANQAVYGTVGMGVGAITQTWHTDRFGIPMDYYTGIFKFGGKWYASKKLMEDGGEIAYWPYNSAGAKKMTVSTKANRELVGVYDENGKLMNGVYSANSPSGIISLKNGKPVTGNVSYGSGTYYIDPEMGFLPNNWM